MPVPPSWCERGATFQARSVLNMRDGHVEVSRRISPFISSWEALQYGRMTIPLQCICGAKLEIDEKFAGQPINCPDCNRELVAAPPARPPERTSGWASASLVVALAGAFTVLGSLAAVALGALALKQIARSPEPLGGRRLAQAGMILGGAFTVVTLGLLWFAEYLPLRGVLRTIEWAGKLQYPDDLTVPFSRGGEDFGERFTVKRPTRRWGKVSSDVYKNPNAEVTDDMVLVNPWEDAYVVCLTKNLDAALDKEARENEAKDRFEQSQLVKEILGRGQKPATKILEPRKSLNGEDSELLFEVELAGVSRLFLVHVLKDGAKIRVIAGGVRKHRFTRLEPELRAAVESFKVER